MVTTDIDASILTDHMMFIATELGVGQSYLADKRIIDFDFLCAKFPRRFPSGASDSWIMIFSTNCISPFVIGRKNWLFARSPKGVAASADLYTLVETAKANGLNAMK